MIKLLYKYCRKNNWNICKRNVWFLFLDKILSITIIIIIIIIINNLDSYFPSSYDKKTTKIKIKNIWLFCFKINI